MAEITLEDVKTDRAENYTAAVELARLEKDLPKFWRCPVCNTVFAHLGAAPPPCPACGVEAVNAQLNTWVN